MAKVFKPTGISSPVMDNRSTTKVMSKKDIRDIKVNDIYAYMANLSLYGNLYNTFLSRHGDLGNLSINDVVSKIDRIVGELNSTYCLDFNNDKNIWFKNYLMSHLASNLSYQLSFQTHEQIVMADIEKILNNIKSELVSIISNMSGVKGKPIKLDIDSQFNFQLFVHVESTKLMNQIEFTKNRMWLDGKSAVVDGVAEDEIAADIETIFSTKPIDSKKSLELKDKTTSGSDSEFHLSYDIKSKVKFLLHDDKQFPIDLIDMVFSCSTELCNRDNKFINLCKWLSENELSSDFDYNPKYVNSRINLIKFSLYKSYFYLISKMILKEWKSAVRKTYEHLKTLSDEERQHFIAKHEKNGGLPLSRIRENVEQNVGLLFELIQNHENDLLS